MNRKPSNMPCFFLLFRPSLLFKRTKVVEKSPFEEGFSEEDSSWLSGCDLSQSAYADTNSSNVLERLQTLPSFSYLVQQSKYFTIVKILNKESMDTLRVWLHVHDSYTVQGATTEATEYSSLPLAALDTSLCLHCMFATESDVPPVPFMQVLLDRLIDVYGNVPEDVMDPQGYTPLHIWIIQKLYLQAGNDTSAMTQMFASTSAPMMQDLIYKRCPLHWLCWNGPPPGSSHDEYFRSMTMSRIETLHILLTAYPEATLMCDVDGRTPLDLALDYPWDDEFFNVIQNATDKVLMTRQKQNPLFFEHTMMKVDQEDALDSMVNSVDSSVGYFLQNGIPYKIRLFNNGSNESSSPKLSNNKKASAHVSKDSRTRERIQRWREFMSLDGDSTCSSYVESGTVVSSQVSIDEGRNVRPLKKTEASSQQSSETHSTTPASEEASRNDGQLLLEC